MSVSDGITPPDGRGAPWWASGDDPAEAPAEDPLTAHRRARRGEGDHDAGGAGTGDDPVEPGAAPPPWWDGAVTGLARVVAQVSEGAHAQAVANARGNGEAGRDSGRDAPTPDASQECGHTGDPGHDHDRDAACQICPVCAALRAVGEQRPELLGHLAEAAHSLSLAARAVLDGHADGGGRSRTDDRLEHIDVQ